jgi:high-affinity iron transporter
VLLGLVALGGAIGVTIHGISDPSAADAAGTRTTAILNAAVLVFREGLEAILVLAAFTASFRGAHGRLRRPVAAGSGLALLASVVTWFAAIWIIGALGGPGLDVQAGTGLLAVVVLLVVMNWFFHRVYWTGWISHHNRRRRSLLAGDPRKLLLGFVLLGFSAVYREGFEVVLFLQNLRLRAGSAVVLEGVALGLAATAAVGLVTFLLNGRLPYKRLLVWTGVLLGFVLVVMIGESAQELQLAGWLPTTTLPFSAPAWLGTWFAFFPTAETIAAQALAATTVVASYFVAEYLRVRRPRRQGQTPARIAEHPPALDPAF